MCCFGTTVHMSPLAARGGLGRPPRDPTGPIALVALPEPAADCLSTSPGVNGCELLPITDKPINRGDRETPGSGNLKLPYARPQHPATSSKHRRTPMTDAGFEAVAAGCPNLEHLDLAERVGCP